jgi:hypothetical protein
VIALLLAMVAIMLPSVAAAQNPDLPAGLDLNGTWELEERGERLSPLPAIVKITHEASGFVNAEFLAGAECFNGQARPYAFIGQLSFKVPGEASLSAPGMIVCSGSSSAVNKCKGSIPAVYVSHFEDVIVTPDLNTGKPMLIDGRRFAQGYDDCTPDSRYDGTHPFKLTRVTCPLEERAVARLEEALRTILQSILRARSVFLTTITAAEQKYGDTYNGLRLTIYYPYSVIGGEWDAEMEFTEEFFTSFPSVIAYGDWTRSRLMLHQMATDAVNRLPEAGSMLDEMNRIEALAPGGTRTLNDLQAARAELEKCRRARR